MKRTDSDLAREGLQTNPGILDDGQATNDCFKVLFVCRDNSVCSIIAEAILKRWGGQDFRAFSAGIHPASEVHPFTVDLLKSRGLWNGSIQTRSCNEFLKQDAQRMNFMISIGEQRLADLPVDWPGNPTIIHWRISEPIVAGNAAKMALAFRRTFGELENRIRLFILVYECELVKRAAA